MGELNQQQKDTIQKLTLAEGQNPESSMHLHGCHRELGGKLIIICLCILRTGHLYMMSPGRKESLAPYHFN